MRDFASCFNDESITVSDLSCKGTSRPAACVQNSVTCFYKTQLSTKKQLLISVNWYKNQMGKVLSINVDDDPSCVCKVDANSWQFWKKKGTRSFETSGAEVEVYWDLSSAKFGPGVEPIDKFYLLVIANAEVALFLGDLDEEAVIKKLIATTPIAQFHLIAREEHVSGMNIFSSNARFMDRGAIHNILIKWGGERDGIRKPELYVSIDQKRVVHVKKLQWNFRGIQTVLVDGLSVDVMWDVHKWLFSHSASGEAVFMFRIRSGLESRPWLEEKPLLKKEIGSFGFSLLIYASKMT